MTTATRPEMKDRTEPLAPVTPSYGTREDLRRGHGALHTRDVEVLGKMYRVRELKVGEAGEIQHRSLKNEIDDKGAVKGYIDQRGTMALRVAYGLINLDGTQLYADPLTEYVELLETTPDVLEPLNKAIVELSATSPEARASLKKDTGRTTN